MGDFERYNTMSHDQLKKQKIVTTYRQVLSGKKKVLPRGTWGEGKNVVILVRYVLEIILKLESKQIPKITRSVIATYNLWGALNRFKSIRKLINFVYPGKYTEFDFTRVPKGHWDNLENIKIRLEQCLDREGIKTSDIPKVVTYDWLVRKGFSAPLKQFNHSPFKLIDAIYQGNFKEQDYKSVPQRYWNDRNTILRKFNEMLLEENIESRDAPMKVTQGMLIKHKLGTALKRHNGSPSKFILSLYPEIFSIKDFPTPNGHWKNINIVRSTIEDLILKNKIHMSEIPIYFTKGFFKSNGLDGLLQEFNGSPMELINTIYPGKFNIMQFKRVPNKYWKNKEHRIEAMRTFCSNNNIGRKELPRLTRAYFLKKLPRFVSIVDRHYESKFYLWIMEAYPEYTFEAAEFDLLIGRDGQVCDSKEELEIHNFLLETLKGAKIIREGRRFTNSVNKETYIPDWIVYQGENKFIIEYFGLYESSRYKGYTERANRKIQYFNNLSNYTFVPIMPVDYRGRDFQKLGTILTKMGLCIEIPVHE